VRDDRNDLVLEFVRFVREFKPKTIMMENVPGLADDRRMGRLVRCLRRAGYSCQFKVLDAAEYGVPQRRRRLILLAGRSGPVPFAKPAKARTTVREAVAWLAHRPRSPHDPLQDMRAAHSKRVAALISRIPLDGGSRSNLGSRSQLSCHKKCAGFHDVYGRMRWDDVAPTITGGFVNPSKGRFLHPAEDRAITLREGSLLQTFPQRYFFSLRGGKYRTAAMIGNALPPEFIRRHAATIRQYIRGQRPSERRSA
jgi:DNA (cytosine-5)-methyltransferase 1